MDDLKEPENVDAQLDRLNEILEQTLATARQAAASVDLSSHDLERMTEMSEISDIPRIAVDYLATDPGLYDVSYEGDLQDYLDFLSLSLERAQMSLEDVAGSSLRAGSLVIVTTM